jgi:hypothetical protein
VCVLMPQPAAKQIVRATGAAESVRHAVRGPSLQGKVSEKVSEKVSNTHIRKVCNVHGCVPVAALPSSWEEMFVHRCAPVWCSTQRASWRSGCWWPCTSSRSSSSSAVERSQMEGIRADIGWGLDAA